MSERTSQPTPIGPQLRREMGVWHTRLVFADRDTRDNFVREAVTKGALSEPERLKPITADELPGGTRGVYDMWPHDGWDGDEPGRHLAIRVWNGSQEAADAMLRFVMTKRNQPYNDIARHTGI